MLRPVIAVVGPTATGKSALALALAEALGDAEVVNADSMQLYRGMDVGTAKLTVAQRRGIPHHQLDVLEPSQEASVAAYQRHARADVEAIRSAGRWAIVVGGSGLYLRALLEELDLPGRDPQVRAEIEARLARTGPTALHAALATLDPAAAGAIDPRNTRRVVRALEVVTVTGRPFAASLPSGDPHWPDVRLGLRAEWPVLDRRIVTRARRMMADGLLYEAAALGPLSRTAARATGYAQALAHLAGLRTHDETVEDIALATRQLARRQVKWFRRDARLRWLDASDPDSLLPAVLPMLEEWQR